MMDRKAQLEEMARRERARRGRRDIEDELSRKLAERFPKAREEANTTLSYGFRRKGEKRINDLLAKYWAASRSARAALAKAEAEAGDDPGKLCALLLRHSAETLEAFADFAESVFQNDAGVTKSYAEWLAEGEEQDRVLDELADRAIAALEAMDERERVKAQGNACE